MSTALALPRVSHVPDTGPDRQRPATRPTPCEPARVGTPYAGPVRLTRRGRVLVRVTGLVLVLAVVGVAVVALGATSAATDHRGARVATRTVLVGEGDTLWDIASGVAAPGHTQEMVLRIEHLNALDGPALAVGQRLAVPRS